MHRLKKALYRLKQAPRAWYSRIDAYLQELGFQKSEADPNLYYIVVGEDPCILVLYVDDLIIIGTNRLLAEFKKDLALEFEMKDIRLMHCYLGLEVAGVRAYLPQTGEVCYGYFGEIADR